MLALRPLLHRLLPKRQRETSLARIMKTFGPDELIRVRVGEEFELSLNVLAASGYEWHVAEANPGIEVLGTSFTTTGGGIGGESRQTFRLRAQQPGTRRLLMLCKRPWDSHQTDSRTVTVNAE